ncbi:hypothetical protein [Streptomyces sp. bgisy091]
MTTVERKPAGILLPRVPNVRAAWWEKFSPVRPASQLRAPT